MLCEQIMFPDIQRSEGTDDSIDAFQWMDAMKSCKVIGAGTSFAQVLRVFVCCNQLEINEYYVEMPDPADIRFMCLKWKEFKEALITVASMKEYKGKKTLAQKLDIFIDGILTQGDAKF